MPTTNRLSLAYETLINDVKAQVSKLVDEVGVVPKNLHSEKFIDLRGMDFDSEGIEVDYLNADMFLDEKGNHYNFSIVEFELEKFCEIIDKLSNINK